MERYLSRQLGPAGPLPSDALDPYQLCLQRVFGLENFRSHQRDIIDSVMSDQDTFVIMPTGGGKTLCYALPAVLSKGVTIVVSPLISLIEDQVSSLIQLPSGGIPAAYLSSTCTQTMITSIMKDLQRGAHGKAPYLKLLYITPERLVSSLDRDDFIHMLYENEFLARFVIDEAHCVSSWGHDFRKDYSRLSVLKTTFPDIPIVCLTATARKKVADDCIRILSIPRCIRFSTGYDRPNLFFSVTPKPDSQTDTHEAILNYILQSAPSQATGIVYCMVRKETEDLADFLRSHQVLADYYHAGQTPRERRRVQQAWLNGSLKVVCATIAYGMVSLRVYRERPKFDQGIDKPDVRYVLHMAVAKSIEGYYQEAGRAGRDGMRSECILFYKRRDIQALGRLMVKPPARKLSRKDKELYSHQ